MRALASRLFLRFIVVATAVTAVVAAPLAAQESDAPHRFGMAATIGVTNTQFPYYADNAVGGSVSAFVQGRPFAGAEVKLSTYPVSSSFAQSPFTAGYRVETRPFPGENAKWSLWRPMFYAGGGISRSHYSNTQYKPAVGWYGCAQASAAIDHPFRRITWRVVEFDYVRTFAPLRQLATYNASTGIAYSFRH